MSDHCPSNVQKLKGTSATNDLVFLASDLETFPKDTNIGIRSIGGDNPT